MQNRSVPCDTVLPHLVYEDVDAAIEWLTRTLGFREHFRYGDPTQGAQLLLGRACVMVRQLLDLVKPHHGRRTLDGVDQPEGVS